jgi:hypothetical protein
MTNTTKRPSAGDAGPPGTFGNKLAPRPKPNCPEPQDRAISAAALLRYGGIKSLADSLGRPVSTLIALASANDPFAITPSRRDGAQWFARIWKRFDLGSGVHVRRVHYKLISQAKPLKIPNGTPYENTLEAWQALIRTSGDARYLDLVPAEDFVDRRNNEPLIYLSDRLTADCPQRWLAAFRTSK